MPLHDFTWWCKSSQIEIGRGGVDDGKFRLVVIMVQLLHLINKSNWVQWTPFFPCTCVSNATARDNMRRGFYIHRNGSAGWLEYCITWIAALFEKFMSASSKHQICILCYLNKLPHQFMTARLKHSLIVLYEPLKKGQYIFFENNFVLRQS